MSSVRAKAGLFRAVKKIWAGTGVATAVASFWFVLSAVMLGAISPANALPSFARQTGQPCGTCHTDYPGLTPYGRLFKLNGYTTGGGKYRTAPFPSWAKPTDALAAYAKKANGTAGTTLSGQPDTSNVWVPPISMMAIYGYTHTQKDQPMLSPYH